MRTKRFLWVFAVVLSVSLLLGFHSNAETVVDETTDTNIPDASTSEDAPIIDDEELVPPTPPEAVIETHTLFTRLWDYVQEHSTVLISYTISLAIFLLSCLIKKGLGSAIGNVLKALSSVKKDTAESNSVQHTVIDTVGKMVVGYNELRDSYERYGATEDDRNRVVGALVAQNTAILEILTTVYCNNSNLPQGAKDLIQLKYANCLKTLSDDEQVRAIVAAVRNNIGAFSADTHIHTEEGEPDSAEEV